LSRCEENLFFFRAGQTNYILPQGRSRLTASNYQTEHFTLLFSHTQRVTGKGRKSDKDLKPYGELGIFGDKLTGAQAIWDDDNKVGTLTDVAIKPDRELRLTISHTHNKSGAEYVPVTGTPQVVLVINKLQVVNSTRTGPAKYGPGVTYVVEWNPDKNWRATPKKVTIQTTPLEESGPEVEPAVASSTEASSVDAVSAT